MDKDSAIQYVHSLMHAMLEKEGSDLFIAVDAPPSIKLNNEVVPLSNQKLTPEQARVLVRSIMNDRHLKAYERDLECNFSISLPEVARFRVNAFTQQEHAGMVLRHIPTEIPHIGKLGLPPVMKELTTTKRGLIIMVGATGSGKSTTLASMVGYRNQNTASHIVTIEDPIEFIHKNNKSIITQREIGIDTLDYDIALKNTLRQAPDVILLGEVRDRETMEYAIAYAETGHLCMTTLHANNTNQAIDRIINFFPEERRQQLLMDLSLNLKAIISQRLTRRADGKGRVPAVEILINSPLMSDLILNGSVGEMKELIAKSNEQGMCTFDQTLFRLIDSGLITFKEGLRHADSINDLRLQLKLNSKNASKDDVFRGTETMSMEDVPETFF
ncbi:MAG: Twitching motility protein PilT [uncultured Thiotrichaceae bacterium]|uniref:Twitching motility protein PilT n=1 Tax=uncultured Thiotrichaceae bacterium TaxID=298394 RepID=A0A6S6TIE4_9GAMM|nr:MAG: Twitching motility protein PilT [uncultured Thiotrichaceae bacterium]